MNTEIGLQHNPDGPSWDEAEDAIAERVGELAEQFARDPAKRTEADDWAIGDMDAEFYLSMQSALADLHEKDPADLHGSDVLARLYRLARVCDFARKGRLRHMAETAAQIEWEDA